MSFEYTPETVEDLVCYWFHVYASAHKSASSLKRDQGILRNYLIPAFGEINLTSLHVRHVDEWFTKLHHESGLSPKSCNDVLGLFRKICNDGERWGFLDKNPTLRIKKLRTQKKECKFWKKEQIQQYLGFWLSKTHPPRIFWAVVIALYTGLRRGELIGLKWDVIDFEYKMIEVKRSYCRILGKVKEETKSKESRRVPINTSLVHHLEKIKNFTLSTGYVLPFIHPDLYHKEFKRSCRDARVKEIRFHDLRHTFASNFLMSGGNIYDLQKMLGHSTIQVTELYTHLIPTHLKDKTEILEF